MGKITVLIPTDFSVQAEYAYLMTKKLGEKMEMDIHFLHVLNVPDTVTMDANGNIQTCGEIDVRYVEEQKEIALRKLAYLKNLYGEKVETHLALGKITDTIVRFASEKAYDLIVTGTKGAWGLKEKIAGSETQMIVRKSEIPVLSLMCDRSDLQINNLLLVHNFEEGGKQDLKLLEKIHASFGAKIHLLQMASAKADHNQIEENMKRFAALNNIGSFESHILHEKDVESGVIHFNQMHNMDIVCIGTHGQGGWFHTSATEKLVNHMFKPIISFHLKNK